METGNKKQFLVFVFILAISCDWTLSSILPTEKLREIVEYEEKLIIGLGNFIQEENEKENEVDDAILSFHGKAQEENLSFELSPTDVLRLYRRVVEGWDGVLEKITCQDCARNNGTDDIERALYKCQRRTLWPRQSDATDSAMALVRLCRVYSLDLNDVISGTVMDTTGASLTLDDIIFIADTASENQFYFEAISWLKVGLEKVKQDSDTPGHIVIKLYRELSSAFYQIKLPKESERYLKECISSYPESKSSKRELKYYQERINELDGEESGELAPRLMGKAVTICEELCRQEQTTPARPLFCRWRMTETPFMFIKEEILSWRPRIVQVHDILTTEETGYFDHISPDMVGRTGVLTWPKQATIGNLRRTKEYGEDELRSTLLDKVLSITGLKTSKRIQAINLGLGQNLKVTKNHYNIETYNAVEYSKMFLRHPLLNWLYFLTDFTGGDVVFPDLNLKAPAVKGSALYWYNAKPNGNPERKTRYCACPVVSGSPWVSSIEIPMHNNVISKGCQLDKKAAYL